MVRIIAVWAGKEKTFSAIEPTTSFGAEMLHLHDEDWRNTGDTLIAAAQIPAVGRAKALVVCDSALNPLADEIGRTVRASSFFNFSIHRA